MSSVTDQLLDPVSRFTQSLVREYLDAHGFTEASESFDAECRRRSSSSTGSNAWFDMTRALGVKRLRRRFPATDEGANASTMEVLVRHLLAVGASAEAPPTAAAMTSLASKHAASTDGPRPSSAFRRGAEVDMDSPVSVHAAKTRRQNVQDEIYSRRAQGEYMPSPGASTSLVGRRLLDDGELSSLMDMESLRQDLAAYEAAFAEAREATVRAADAERTRSRRALASGRPSRQGKRAEEKTGAARPSRSRGGESRRSRSPPPSRSRRRGPPILSPLGKGKRRISDGNVSAAPASSSPSGGGAAKAQRRSPGSDAPATIALPYSHMSLHQLSAMANRTGELARKDEMQAQARKDAMQMLVGSGPVMRAVREELRQEQRAHDAQMRAHKAEGRGIHARSGARSPSPPAKRRGGDASPAARGADSGAPRIARARSDVLLDRRRKLLGTAVTRTRRSKKRREEPATQDAMALLSADAMLPVSQRVRMVQREIAVLRDNDQQLRRSKEVSLQRGPETSSSLEKERLQEQLGKRIREECSLCKLTFAGTNLPMVVTHKAINDMRTSWGHPPPQDRFATFPACYDTARVCYFCAQFFETRGPSRIEASKSQAKKQGFVDSPSQRR